MNYEMRSITDEVMIADWLRASATRGISTPRANETMFLATADFIADYFGGRIEITQGVTRLAPGHELVKRYPERFTAIEIRRGQPGVRDLVQAGRTGMLPAAGVTHRVISTPLASGGPPVLAPAAPREPLGELPAFVEPAGQCFRVTFTDPARQQLREAARVATDGAEWGGWLYGTRIRGWDPTVLISKAVGAGPDAERSAHSLRYPVGEWRTSWEGGALECIGFWHSHSHDFELGISDQDRDSAREELLDVEARWGSYFVELLAEVAEGDSWQAPRLSALIIRREETFGRVVCERADVDEL